MTAATAFSLSPAIFSLSSPASNHPRQLNSDVCSYSYISFSASKPNTSRTLPRLEIAPATVVARKPAYRPVVVSGLVDGDSGTYPEEESSDSSVGATIDIKLPRRRLLVQFTCDLCGERTKRLINRLAYERGLVYVQCAGCLRHHKLVDNLGLVVEHELNISAESRTDQSC